MNVTEATQMIMDMNWLCDSLRQYQVLDGKDVDLTFCAKMIALIISSSLICLVRPKLNPKDA